MKNLKKLKEVIYRYKSFFITGHERPDGDTVGSALALMGLLRKMGKNVYISMDKVPDCFRFLPWIGYIKTELPMDEYEVAILLECSDESRLMKGLELDKFKKVVVIDHHEFPPKIGDLKIYRPKAAACAQMIYELFALMNMRLTKNEALLLYVALLTDTGKFQWRNTTPDVFVMASKLFGYGLNPISIFKSLYAQKTIPQIKMLGSLLQNIKTTCSGKIAYLELKDKAGEFFTDDILDITGIMNGVSVFAIFRCDGDKTKVNMRAFEDIDLGSIMRKFGGGGHKYAAGCYVNKPLKEAKRIIFFELKKHIMR